MMSKLLALVLLGGRLNLEVNSDADGNKSKYTGKILQPLAKRICGVVSPMFLASPLPLSSWP